MAYSSLIFPLIAQFSKCKGKKWFLENSDWGRKGAELNSPRPWLHGCEIRGLFIGEIKSGVWSYLISLGIKQNQIVDQISGENKPKLWGKMKSNFGGTINQISDVRRCQILSVEWCQILGKREVKFKGKNKSSFGEKSDQISALENVNFPNANFLG